jgi:hypothetical protein
VDALSEDAKDVYFNASCREQIRSEGQTCEDFVKEWRLPVHYVFWTHLAQHGMLRSGICITQYAFCIDPKANPDVSRC